MPDAVVVIIHRFHTFQSQDIGQGRILQGSENASEALFKSELSVTHWSGTQEGHGIERTAH
jgi:hypothetical protein